MKPGELVAQGGGVVVREVDLVGHAVQAELHGLSGGAAVEVVEDLDKNFLGH
jgi:hypothetical protein